MAETLGKVYRPERIFHLNILKMFLLGRKFML